MIVIYSKRLQALIKYENPNVVISDFPDIGKCHMHQFYFSFHRLLNEHQIKENTCSRSDKLVEEFPLVNTTVGSLFRDPLLSI